VAERILAVLGGPRFADQSAVERGAYFDALASLGGPTVIATLAAWLGHWSLGGGGAAKARRDLAAGALARIDDPAAKDALKRAAGSFLPGVRGAGRRALNAEKAA